MDIFFNAICIFWCAEEFRSWLQNGTSEQMFNCSCEQELRPRFVSLSPLGNCLLVQVRIQLSTQVKWMMVSTRLPEGSSLFSCSQMVYFQGSLCLCSVSNKNPVFAHCICSLLFPTAEAIAYSLLADRYWFRQPCITSNSTWL